jgi:DNA-binding SARP family transcriptional activator/tetratricopeptide (TPR) repeat protein/TolB-like protein
MAMQGDKESSPHLQLQVLGPIELAVESTGEPIPVQSAKMRALLALLSVAPNFTESRRKIAPLLWSKSAEEQARQSLRQLLSNFRRGAAPHTAGVIVFDDVNVGLDPSLVAVDRASLTERRSSLEISDLRQIVDAYRGDFASGAEIGEPEFDDWLAAERMRTRESAIAAFDRLVRLLAEGRQHAEALSVANRLAEIDPVREESQRLVITQEAAVSGRASAMQRFEAFRILLRDELGVRPEPATLELIEQLRRKKTSDSLDTPPETPGAALVATQPGTHPSATRQIYKYAVISVVVAALAIGASFGYRAWNSPADRLTFVGEDSGRISVVVLPFETGGVGDALKAQVANLESETYLAFARNSRLSVVTAQSGASVSDPVSFGRSHRARYAVQTRLTETPSGVQADINVFDTATGISVWAGPLAITGSESAPIRFARQYYRYVYAEIAIYSAKTLPDTAADPIPAMLWKAEAARIRTRVGNADPNEVELFEKVLERDPRQLYALLGLSDHYILKVAREQSKTRAQDVGRAETLLLRAREQAPNLAEVAFSMGMINKLQRKFEQAGLEFDRAFQLDRTHWNAAAQAAHIKLFLGQFDEAYVQMEAATGHLLPDIASAETAYIAGETALMTGHPERAITYLDLAISGNPTVSRIHGMRAAALHLAGRQSEASAAAATCRNLSPTYTPEMMALRGGPTVSARYKSARDEYVAAFRTAWVTEKIN